MTRAFLLRTALLVFCLFALPALVAAQTLPVAPTPVPDGMIAADADARIFPPLGLPVAPDAAAPAAPAAPTDAQPRTGWFEEGEWSRVLYRGFDGHDYDLYSVGGFGGYLRQVFDTPAMEAQPMLSPDARQVAFVADYDGDFDLYLADYIVDGQLGNVRRLVDMPENEYAPVWSADGTKLTFYSFGDQGEIFTVRADGSQLTRLTFDAAFDGYPTWSPDGQQIAFSSTRSGGYRIHVMNADGSNVRQLSNQPGGLFPTWSPDGRAIAYSADPDGDGWLDLMVMDAAGGNQRRVLNANPATDIQHPTWSPDGQQLAFASVYYISYYGNWYITSARIETICAVDDCYWVPILAPDYSFDPAWGKIDLQPPSTTIPALPAESPARFEVTWGGSDVGPANIRHFQLQVQKNGGAWADLHTDTGLGQVEVQGVGGDTFAFRSRGVDYAGNVEPWPAAPDAITRVESRPPVTELQPLEAWTRYGASIPLVWQSDEPGGSGITGYLVQFRRNGGAWTNLPGAQGNGYDFVPEEWQAQTGDHIDFRLRATDGAQNVEPWPPDPGDGSTTLFDRVAAGHVVDNAGTPVIGATAEVTPAALAAVSSGAQGDYAAYFGPAPTTATLRWAKPGYGALPPAGVSLAGRGPTTTDAGLLVVLPPADDVVANGGFEAAGWGAWQPGGSRPPALTTGGLIGAAAALGEPAVPFAARQRLTTNDSFKSMASLHLDGDDNLFALWCSAPRYDMLGSLMGAQRRADGTWLPATKLLDGICRYNVIDVTRDEAGQLHLATGGESGAYLLHQSGVGWSAPEAIPGTGPSQGAKIIAGPGGRLDVFVLRASGDDHLVHYRRAADGTWAAPSDLGIMASDFKLLEIDGTVHLFGHRGGYNLLHRRLGPGGAWGPVEPTAITAAGGFAVAADSAGRIHLGWLSSSFDGELRYSWLDDAQWGPDERVSAPVGTPAMLTGWGIRSDGQPQALVVGGIDAFYLLRTADGWTTEYLQTQTHYAAAAMIVDAGGTPHVTFLDRAASGAYQPFYTARDDAGNWLTPIELFQPASIYGHDGVLALDSAGNVHAVWQFSLSQYAADDLAYAGPAPATATGNSTLSQAVVVPAGMAHPTLSFLYAGAGALQLTLDAPGRAPSVVALPPSPAGMRHVSLPLADYAGRTVTLSFALSQTAGRPPTWATLDEVTLGAAHADAWVAAISGRGVPGRNVTHTLGVGNRGAAEATGVVLTYALPPQLSFVSADPAPSSTAPLRWNLGALPPGGQVTIELTAAVAHDVAGQRAVTSTATLTTGNELETLNNSATVSTPLGALAYVPMTAR
ncbi:MAG: PD40 domain-containing protein [Anaerolineae bacterium]|nr:PD40 domain-containing protein [Anaerolineae bacterium]